MENIDVKICPVCNAELKEEDGVTVCPVCGVAYHQKCWEENHGCATFGCSQNHREASETPQAAEAVEATVQQSDINKPVFCPKCGAQMQENQKFCTTCGQKIDESVIGEKKTLSKKNMTIIIAAAAALVVIIGIVIVSSTMLFGDDKAAYDIIISESDRFKDPTSIVLMSGSLSDSKNLLYAGISAINSFGARNTSYYLISSVSLTEVKYPTDKYTDKDSLNIKKINKALERKLKK